METGKNRGLVWIASSSVSMEGCQRKSIWTEHSTPRSASPLSQPPVFPGLSLKVKNAQRSKTVKVWSPQREKPGLNAKVPRNVRLRRVCSERSAWDRNGQGNLESAAGRSRDWRVRSRRKGEQCADALAAPRQERPPR